MVRDAKYRIDQGLNDILTFIHAYRDALVREAGSAKVEGIVHAAYGLTLHLSELGTTSELPRFQAGCSTWHTAEPVSAR